MPIVMPVVISVVALVAVVSYRWEVADQEHTTAAIMSEPVVATLVDGPNQKRQDPQDEGSGDDRFLEAAAASFSRCMRASGIDFPDLIVLPDGGLERPNVMEEADAAVRRAGRNCRSKLPGAD